MQGQSSTSNSSPQNSHFDHGSSANNLGLVQHNVVPEDALHGDDHTTLGRINESSPSVITENQVNPEELNEGNGWHSFLGAQTGEEERYSEPNNDQVFESINAGLSNGPVTNGPSTLHSDSSEALPCNIDLNAEYKGEDEVRGVDLYLFPFKQGGSETNQVPPASDSSILPVISSGTAGNAMEENENRPDLSLDGRCLSSKRKEPENISGEPSLGGSSSSTQQAENSEWRTVTVQDNTSGNLNISTLLNNPSNVNHPEQLNPRLGTGMIAAASGMLQRPSAANADSFHRNIRLRTENEQDFVSASALSTGTPTRNSNTQPSNQSSILSTGTLIANSHVQLPNQPSVLFPFNRSSDSRSAEVAVNTTLRVPPLVNVPSPWQTLQPSRWNWVTSSRASGVSSISAATDVHEGSASRQEESSRNTPRMSVPQTERGSLAQNQTNVSCASGSENVFGDIASTSRDVSSSGAHQSPSPSLFSQPNTAGSEIVQGSITTSAGSESGMHSYPPPHPGASSTGWQNGHCPLHPGASSTGWPNSSHPPHPGASSTGWPNSSHPPHPGAASTGWLNSSHPQHPGAASTGWPNSSHPPHPHASSTGWPNSSHPLHTGASVPGWQNSYLPQHSGPAATGGQSSNRLPHLGSFANMRENAFARAANARPPLPYFRSMFVPRAMVQADGLPYDQRRSRLVSEVRQAMGLVHRNGALRLEDVMVIDHSVLYEELGWNVVHGVDEEPDVHEDMRLDVDDMSYEELLDLEEHIGNVSTGLNEEVIQAHLKQRKYQSIRIGLQVEDEPCCICQEDYADGEDIGTLDCGHDFHVNCIKQWLVQKNLCPICKMKALAT